MLHPAFLSSPNFLLCNSFVRPFLIVSLCRHTPGACSGRCGEAMAAGCLPRCGRCCCSRLCRCHRTEWYEGCQELGVDVPRGSLFSVCLCLCMSLSLSPPSVSLSIPLSVCLSLFVSRLSFFLSLWSGCCIGSPGLVTEWEGALRSRPEIEIKRSQRGIVRHRKRELHKKDIEQGVVIRTKAMSAL